MTKARHPMQPIVRSKDGTYRFKENSLVRFLLERGPFDLNGIAMGGWTNEDREQLAQLIGYSVGGFCDLSYASQRVKAEANRDVLEKMGQRKKMAK